MYIWITGTFKEDVICHSSAFQNKRSLCLTDCRLMYQHMLGTVWLYNTSTLWLYNTSTLWLTIRVHYDLQYEYIMAENTNPLWPTIRVYYDLQYEYIMTAQYEYIMTYLEERWVVWMFVEACLWTAGHHGQSMVRIQMEIPGSGKDKNFKSHLRSFTFLKPQCTIIFEISKVIAFLQ